MEKDQLVKALRIFGQFLQFRYYYTLDAAGLAWRYQWRADEIYPSISLRKAAVSVHDGDESSVNDKQLVKRLDRERNIGQFL